MYVVCCILLNLEDFFLLVHLLEVQEVCLCLQTASRAKTFMYITARISATIVSFTQVEQEQLVLNDFYWICSFMSATCSLSPVSLLLLSVDKDFAKWISFSEKLLHLIEQTLV